jgi:hypothetical protein
MKRYKPLYFLWFVFFNFLLLSCRKDVQYRCPGNCSDVVLAGQIWDESGKKGAKGLTVTARLYRYGSCWICTPEVIGVAKTGEDGRFIINSRFDTSELREKHLGVSFRIPEGYLKNATPAGPTAAVRTETENYHGAEFYEVDNNAMQNMYFPIFKRTLVTFALKRTTPPVAGHKGVSLGLSLAGLSSWWGAENEDTSLTWHTGENVYTKYTVMNWVNDSSVQQQIDSIFCQPGGNNIVSITY